MTAFSKILSVKIFLIFDFICSVFHRSRILDDNNKLLTLISLVRN